MTLRLPTTFAAATLALLLSITATSALAATFRELLDKAQALSKKHDYDQAIRLFDQAVEFTNEPNRYKAYYSRGVAYAQTGRHERAVRDFNKTIRLNPQYAQAYQSRGLAYQNLDKRDAALKEYRHAIQLDRHWSKPYWRTANLYSYEGNYNAALKIYDEAIKNNANVEDMYIRRAQIFRVMGQYKRAQADIAWVIDHNPKNADAFNRRGMLYLQYLHDTKNAIVDFERGVKLDPQSAKYPCNLGAAYIISHQPKKAIEALTLALKLEPGSASCLNNRGVAWEELGQNEKAKADFEASVAIDPKKPDYFANHARVAMKTGDEEDAVGDFVAIDRQSGTRVETQTDYKTVVEQFNKVIKLNPKDATNYYNRGVANFCLSNFTGAAADFARFLQLADWRGDSRIFASILDALALRQLHKNSEANSVLVRAATYPAGEWSRTLLAAFRGDVSEEQLLDRTPPESKRAMIKCFIGLDMLARGKINDAKERLKWVRKHGVAEADEYALACSALSRLDPDEAARLAHDAASAPAPASTELVRLSRLRLKD